MTLTNFLFVLLFVSVAHSLSDACRAHIERINEYESLNKVEDWLRCINHANSFKEYTKILTIKEFCSVHTYTNNLYKPLNCFFRGQVEDKNLKTPRWLVEYTAFLNAGLKKAPKKHSGVVHRWTRTIPQNLNEGDILKNKVFLSTSLSIADSQTKMDADEAIAYYRITDVKNEADITEFSLEGSEDEVLIGQGRCFTVTKVHPKGLVPFKGTQRAKYSMYDLKMIACPARTLPKLKKAKIIKDIL
ncbi:GTPase Der [Acrasis kona]|uniref:GTPase Der n=1 Tax=Acrasis kona TaxID=1008807 RepID=A0AAW2ZQV2_9EUKA